MASYCSYRKSQLLKLDLSVLQGMAPLTHRPQMPAGSGDSGFCQFLLSLKCYPPTSFGAAILPPPVLPPGTVFTSPPPPQYSEPSSGFLEEVFLDGGDPQRLPLGPAFTEEVILRETCEGVRAAGEGRKRSHRRCDWGCGPDSAGLQGALECTRQHGVVPSGRGPQAALWDIIT